MLSTTLFYTVHSKLISTYEAVHGVGSATAIPWAQIIAFIMSLLGGGICPKPATPVAAREQATQNDFYIDYAVRVALIQEYGIGAWRRHDGPGASQAVKETIKSLDDTTMTEILAT